VDPTCQKYMVDAARALTDSCGGLVSGIQAGVRDPQQRNDLARAAKAATEALQQLVNSTLCVGSRTQANREAMAAAAFEIQDAVARLMSSEGNPNLIITASRNVASAQGQLIQAAKSVAKYVPIPVSPLLVALSRSFAVWARTDALRRQQ
jgi:hypothetical protein